MIGKSQAVASLTQAMGYSFNAAGQLATVTTPSGRVVAYGYSNNRPVSVSVGGVSVLSSVTYEPFGPNGGWIWGNSGGGSTNTHTRVFDKDYRTTRVTSDLPVSGVQPYFDKQFSWDQMSRITSVTDLANSALNATYGFDALDRVTSASQGAASWGYTYNGIGDRLTSTVGAASTTYGYQSGTHRLTGLSGSQTKSYTFDAAGNMTSDGVNTWVYGGNNRPTSAGSTTFLINALGQRVKKTTGATATRFVYDEAGRLWGEYDASGALIQEIVWLEDLPVAVLRDNGSGGTNIHYIHPDHLGTPRAITRASDNQVVWKWDNTEPFGNSAPNEDPNGLGTFAFNLRFPGQYFDQETGKHYNYHRDYDPNIGRYIESDPIGLRGGLGTYGYVSGDPLSRFDRHGLQEQCETCGSGRGAGGGGGGGGGGPNSWPNYDPPLENVYPEFLLFGGGAAARGGGGAAAAAGAAIRNLYNKCKKFRCKPPEVHDAHHPFGGRKMCHLQLNCWLDGVKGSGFEPIRIPYPCDAPAPPFFKDTR